MFDNKIFNKRDQKNLRQCLRRNLPAPEILLWLKIKSKQLNGLKFRRQHGIGKYVADFYCPERRLVVEVDGNSHYTREGKDSDNERDSYFRSLDITVLRFTNKEVLDNIDEVLGLIINHPSPSLKKRGKRNDSRKSQKIISQ